MNARKLYFTGVYFDGRQARKHRVAIDLSPHHLKLLLPEGQTLEWKVADLGMSSPGPRDKPPFHLEHTVNEPQGRRLETLAVEDPEFLTTLRSVTAVSLHPTLRPVSGMRVVTLALAVLAAPFFLYGLWTAAIPKLSDQAAMRVPVSWEEKLGDRVLQELPEGLVPSSNPELEKVLQMIAMRLLSAAPDQPYNIRIHVSPLAMVNAVAFPGGHILVFQGLLNASESPEELAGVLAHEIQHVALRHSTRGIIRGMASSLLLTLIVGDMNGMMNAVLGVAGELEGLSHSRKMEREADRNGMEMILAADVDPTGMVRMFEKLAREERRPFTDGKSQNSGPEDDSASWTDYFSTHPAEKDRISGLKKQVAKAGKKSYTSLLPDLDWKALVHREASPPGNGENPSLRQINH